jgi:formylglycine-generating enzyme required for sulfatase activity
MTYLPQADSICLGDGVSNNTIGNKTHQYIKLPSIESVFAGSDSIGILNLPEAFYLMKYEISQRQYVDFLNSITAEQQLQRVENSLVSSSNDAAFPSFENNRNSIRFLQKWQGTTPAIFYSNQPFVACNGLNATDVLSYLCWAGLRPLSEIEYEYACRGPNKPIAKEMPWGNASFIDVNKLSDSTLINESYIEFSNIPTFGRVNCGLPIGEYYLQGPGRSGALFSSTTDRISAGSGYFGNADLAGNVWELCVSLSPSQTPIQNGTGYIEDLLLRRINWPREDVGYLYRGGGWNSIVINRLDYPYRDIAVSDRYYAGINTTIRRNTTGGRGAL